MWLSTTVNCFVDLIPRFIAGFEQHAQVCSARGVIWTVAVLLSLLIFWHLVMFAVTMTSM